MSEELEKLRKELFELKYEASNKETAEIYAKLHAAGWPPALIKSVYDPFDYALGLKDGTIIFFSHAVNYEADRRWVTVFPHDMHSGNKVYENSFNTRICMGRDRGIDIRVSDIMWACDAPYGS